MENIYELLRSIFFTKVFGEITLYIILSTIIKYLFVFIVLYFILTIVKFIANDIKRVFKDSQTEKSYIKLVSYPPNKFSKENQYVMIDSILRIGREYSNDLILEDENISKIHAIILKKEDGYYIEDLKSLNGTLLNNEYVHHSQKLNDRDVIAMGEYYYEFHLGEN